MPSSIYERPDLLLMTLVSFIGILLVGTLVTFPPIIREGIPSSYRKTVAGSIFASCCILGVVAALSPQTCLRFFRPKSAGIHMKARFPRGQNLHRRTSSVLGLRIEHSHHPLCKNFSIHEFRVGKRTFCTGCMGTLLGALISLLGASLFFFGFEQSIQGELLVGLGMLGVTLGIIQIPFLNLHNRLLRFALNTYFILGMFLILLGVDAAVKSLAADLLSIALSLFWLYVRISLTRWDHSRICRSCDDPC